MALPAKHTIDHRTSIEITAPGRPFRARDSVAEARSKIIAPGPYPRPAAVIGDDRQPGIVVPIGRCCWL